MESSSTMVTSSDDDGPISVANALAKEAALQFQQRKFADCLKFLHQILQMKPDDPKILHNIAIVDNCQDGFSNPKRFLEVLINLKKRSEELSRASGEHVEAVSNTGSKGIIGTKGSNGGPNQVSLNSTPSIYDDELDGSVIMFNIAATWYNLHEYEKSFSVLEPLYQNIEPVAERVAYHVCLLLLDVALICCHVSRAADVISYMERVFVGNTLVNQGDNGSFTQQQSTNLVSNSSSLPNNAIVSDAANSDSNASANGLESPLSATLSEDTLYDSFMSTFDTGGQNLTRPSNDRPRTQVDESFITSDKLHLYKIWLLLLTRNLKAAKREVKMAMNVARGKDYSLALFLKSQLEYARGNHRKAIKLLMASSNRTETGTSSMYYNNLGCIYYQLGKYHTSTIFFSKALKTNSSLQKEKPLKLLTFAQDKSLLLVYNCGVTYLATGKPLLAASCFREASSVFYKRPLLWLRMAECCLMALEQNTEITVRVVGRGKWRQLVIENGISKNGQVENVKESIFSGDRQQFKLSIPFARSCLSNALHLLTCSDSNLDSQTNSASEENESRETAMSKSVNTKASNLTVGSGQVNSNGDVKEQKVANSLNASLQSSIIEFEGICGKQNQMIKQAVLADLAFVDLELGNPLKALSTARSLLRLPECSRVYIFLGNLYAAEALCLLNRLKEASEHLYVYLSGENNVELPYSKEDCDQLQMKKAMEFDEPTGGGPVGVNASSPDVSKGVAFLNPEEGRGILWAELAVMSAFRGDVEEANKLVEQALLVIPNHPDVVLTAIYVDLVRGNTQGAIARLKQCTRVRFLPSNFSSKGSS